MAEPKTAKQLIKRLKEGKRKRLKYRPSPKIVYTAALSQSLAGALKTNTVLLELNFGENNIGEHGVHGLAEGLKANRSVTRLYLGGNDIGDSGVIRIAGALKLNRTLLLLYLNKNRIGPKGAQSLADAVAVNESLRYLSLSDNEVGDAGTRELARALKKNSVLERLFLGGNGIGDAGASEIGGALKENRTLEVLFLWKNVIGPTGARDLTDALKKNKSLKSLDLWKSGIGSQGAKHLADALEANEALRNLNLYKNNIGTAGLKHLARALKQNETLHTLSLWDNEIGPDGAKILANVLKVNLTLQELKLGRNNIGSPGAKDIAKALVVNETLKALHLWANVIGDDGGRAIFVAMKSNHCVTNLDLDNNNIEADTLKRIKKRIELNKKYEGKLHPALETSVGAILKKNGFERLASGMYKESICTVADVAQLTSIELKSLANASAAEAKKVWTVFQETFHESTLVIHSGTYCTQAGFAKEEYPSAVFKTAKPEYYLRKYASFVVFPGTSIPAPITAGVVTNWLEMEKIWQSTFYNRLCVDPSEHPVLLTEPLLNPKALRERMTKTMFQEVGVPALYIYNGPMLALISTGRTSGLVVDSGYSLTSVVPILEGHAVVYAVVKDTFGGGDVTAYLVRLLAERGYVYTTAEQIQYINKMKEDLCYVAVDFDAEMERVSDTHELEAWFEPTNASIDFERFKCTELLFKPSLFIKERNGLTEMLLESVKEFEPDFQRTMYANIVLSGGNTKFKGFAERLERELGRDYSSWVPRSSAKVFAPSSREYCTWTGGALLAKSAQFPKRWMSRNDYLEHGPSIVHTKCT